MVLQKGKSDICSWTAKHSVKCEYQHLPIMIHDTSRIYSLNIVFKSIITKVNGKSFVPEETMNNWSLMRLGVVYKIYLSNLI